MSRPAEVLPVSHGGTHVEAAPLCPWREPERDLAALFPGSTGYREETRILSAARLELTRRLGHPPTGDDNALHIYRVRRGDAVMGAIVVRRVRGEYGAVEIVVGARPDGSVQGVRIQRSREPEPIAEILRSPAWLAKFSGRKAEGDWAAISAGVPPDARTSARAMADGVRSAIVLLDTADRVGLTAGPRHH